MDDIERISDDEDKKDDDHDYLNVFPGIILSSQTTLDDEVEKMSEHFEELDKNSENMEEIGKKSEYSKEVKESDTKFTVYDEDRREELEEITSIEADEMSSVFDEQRTDSIAKKDEQNVDDIVESASNDLKLQNEEENYGKDEEEDKVKARNMSSENTTADQTDVIEDDTSVHNDSQHTKYNSMEDLDKISSYSEKDNNETRAVGDDQKNKISLAASNKTTDQKDTIIDTNLEDNISENVHTNNVEKKLQSSDNDSQSINQQSKSLNTESQNDSKPKQFGSYQSLNTLESSVSLFRDNSTTEILCPGRNRHSSISSIEDNHHGKRKKNRRQSKKAESETDLNLKSLQTDGVLFTKSTKSKALKSRKKMRDIPKAKSSDHVAKSSLKDTTSNDGNAKKKFSLNNEQNLSTSDSDSDDDQGNIDRRKYRGPLFEINYIYDNDGKKIDRSSNEDISYLFTHRSNPDKNQIPPSSTTKDMQSEEIRNQILKLKEELQKFGIQIDKKKPKLKKHYPYIFNHLGPYRSTDMNPFKDEQGRCYGTRMTAQSILDPWEDYKLDHTVMPKKQSKSTSDNKSINSRPSRSFSKSSKSTRCNAISADVHNAMQPIRQPRFPRVCVDYRAGVFDNLCQDDVPYLRREISDNLVHCSKKRHDEDYIHTKQDFYNLQLDKLAEISDPIARENIKRAYLAYLQNSPGSSKAIKECIEKVNF